MVPKTSVKMPSRLRRSDKRARRIWKKAHDSAIETYGEAPAAHRVAYAALKHQYKKTGGDRWVPKGHKGPSDPQAARSAATRPKSTDRPAAPTAGGKVAATPAEARRRSHEARLEYGGWRREKGRKKRGS